MFANMQFRIFCLPISCIKTQKSELRTKHTGSLFSTFKLFVMQSRTTNTLLLENTSLYFVLQQVFEMVTFHSFFFSNVRPYSIIIFHKCCMQSNQQVALSRLLHQNILPSRYISVRSA
jgi:hypothetical protein